MSREYREHRPSAVLEPFVDCFWTRVGYTGFETRVIPDGAVDIIFDLAAPSPSSAAFVVGPMTKALIVRSVRKSDFVAVRFHPGGAQPLFGNSMRELKDHRLRLDTIWSHQVASEWTERVSAAGSAEARVRTLEGLLAEKVPCIRLPEPRVREAIRLIYLSGGSLCADKVCQGLGLTRQHMTRLFDHHVGVGVKFFSRIIRLRLVLDALEQVTARECSPDWATVCTGLRVLRSGSFRPRFQSAHWSDSRALPAGNAQRITRP